MWRTVVISGVSVRWIDLGTRLILRHVVRVLGADEEQDDNNSNNDRSNNETQGEGEGNNQNGDGGDGGGAAGDTTGGSQSDTDREARAGLATAEVDLNEVRWAECTVRERQRKPSRSNAKKLASKFDFHTPRTSKDVCYMDRIA